MAKASNLNARLISLKEETDQLKANELQLQKLYALEDKITDAQFKKVEALEAQNKVLQKSKSQYELLLKLQRDKAKLLQAELKDYDDIDTNLVSIGNTIGKNTKAYEFQKEKLDKTKVVLESIGNVITKNSKINDKDKDQMTKVLKAYKQNQASILEASKLKARDKISQQEYLKLVEDSRKTYSDLRSEIELSAEATALLGDHIAKMDNEIDSFANTAKKSASALKGVESAIDNIGGSGVEGVRELGDVLKTATNGGKGLALAMGALAGVAAGMAYNFGLIGDKLGTIAGYDKKIAGLTGEIDGINQKVDMGVKGFGDRNFVMEEAMLGFSESVAQMGNQFQAASKTALFGNKLGSVGYGASQLQMAGISAENIAESMQAASDATGKMPTGKMAADMSIMAQRTGQSTESIATINETFQRLDKVSEKTALNLQEGVRAMADKAGVNLGSAMAEIAEASKDALSYQIKGSSQLAKQVIYAKSLGVSFNAVAKAGQNMVLNYKDSIKSEMSLSAMLGKNVNLSEVRAKFMSGDNEGAMKSLKAQGLNPKDMNMFQQQALQEALGGMDLNSIQKITENTGKSGGDLKEGGAGGANAQYLAAKSSAEAGLAAANAMTSAAFELKRIAIQAEKEKQRQDAIIRNVGGLADKMNERDQQGFLKNAETMLTTALISTVATVVTTFLMSKGGGLFGKLFKKGAPVIAEAAPTVAKTAAKTTTKTAAKTAAKTTTKTAAKTVATTAGKTAATTTGKTVAGVAGKAGAQVAEKVGAKGIAKVGAKALGKSLLKKIPVIGLLAGVGFGLSRLAKGDYAGAAMELASGAAGTIPGIGTAASIGIDTALAAKDMGAFDKAPTAAAAGAKPAVVSKEQQAKPIETGTKPTVEAVNTMGQKQIDAQKMAADKAKVTLTETQYGAKLQQEIVALLGINAQFLGQISENTAKDASININGKALQSSLLNQARRLYGVARTA
jgi:hypothetical protein